MRKTLLVGISTLLMSWAAVAQVNKAPNQSFEEVDKKIKGPGEIEYVVGWYSPEGTPAADIFTTETKKPEVQVPMNIRGRAETHEGNNYVGLLAYSEREANPRTYIQAKMEKKLVAGKKYCLKMHVSLSDLSKYACDNFGMLISAKAVKAKDIESGEYDAQLKFHENGLITDQFEWVPICIEFEADGTERYITIGNFAPQSSVKTERMRRPREFKTPQTRDAYYYVDNVSVIATGHLEEPCDCRPEDDTPKLDVVYNKTVSEGMEGTPIEKIEHTVVHFAKNNADIADKDKAKIDEVAAQMTEDPTLKIMIEGHLAPNENAEIAQARAKAVFTYLTENKGIDASRLQYKGVVPEADPDAGPAVTDAHADAEARRVQFKGQ